jgi:hypothetical protein
MAKAVEKENHLTEDRVEKAARVMANASHSIEVFQDEMAKAAEKENHLTADRVEKAARVMANVNRSIVVFHVEMGKAQQSVNHFHVERESHLEKGLLLPLMERNYQKLHRKKEKLEDIKLIRRK